MIDFTQELMDDGAVIPDGITMQTNGNKFVALTLGRAASHALFSIFVQDQELSGEEKFRRGNLGFIVRDSKNASLQVEDIALIKEVIAKLYGPMVVRLAWPLLDPTLAGEQHGKESTSETGRVEARKHSGEAASGAASREARGSKR